MKAMIVRGVAPAFAVVLAVTLIVPEPASALPLVGDLSLDPVDWAVSAFKGILQFIVGESIDDLGHHLLALLLAVPLLTDKGSFPGLNAYRTYVQGGAWGILSLTCVIAALRYWAAGFTGSGSYEALTGFIRTAASIVMLLIFVPAFDMLCRAVNMFTAALIRGPGGMPVAPGLMHTLSMDSIADGGIAMLVTMAAIGMAIVLLVVKVIVTALLAVLFVASPLAIALFPVEEVAFLLRLLLQAIFGILVFPVLWAVCFGTFAVLPADALFPGSFGDTIMTLLVPLIALASLIIALRLPFKVLSMALQGSVAPGLGRGMGHIRNASYVKGMLTRT